LIEIKHILLLNIITIGLDTNYSNLQGSSPLLIVVYLLKFIPEMCAH